MSISMAVFPSRQWVPSRLLERHASTSIHPRVVGSGVRTISSPGVRVAKAISRRGLWSGCLDKWCGKRSLPSIDIVDAASGRDESRPYAWDDTFVGAQFIAPNSPRRRD
ncbi:MAG TPA: hypothetical protein VNE17_06355 [Nitrolancea sp.]|nr:hypothetical protein [Nitrolancea sp.]